MKERVRNSSKKDQNEITRKGNPGKPHGEEGAAMLKRMNESHAPLTEWALSFLNFQKADCVLDIGCGGGATLRRISAQIANGHLAGVDYSPVSASLSRELNAADVADGKMQIIEASVERLPFGDESFDKITTVESFYFWPDPANDLKEVLRVLKKNGVFLLAAEIYQKEGLKKEAYENIEKYQLFNPTKEEFRELFLNAGFSRAEIHTKRGEDWICVEGVK